MQPIKQLTRTLTRLASDSHCLFTLADLHGALPTLTPGALRAVVSRVERDGVLNRVCRGMYLYPHVSCTKGLLLYHIAARLRADQFNYISMESVLSDAGVISQVTMNWVTLMSTGRSHIVKCGNIGSIEFIHTKKQPMDVMHHIFYDARCHLWRASVALALKDMKAAKRSMDLINWDVVDELV